MTEQIARAILFDGRADFYAEQGRLVNAIVDGEPLTPRDWHRALAATEIGFISWVLGAAGNWSSTSGIDEHEALERIFPIQKKLALVRPWPEPYARPGHDVAARAE